MRKPIFIFVIAGAVVLAGCTGGTPSEKRDESVPLADVAESPGDHNGTEITVTGTVGRESVNDYYLTDGDHRLAVEAWAPFNVAPCPPSSPDCEEPPQMSSYLDEPVTLQGTLTATDKDYKLVNVTLISDSN